MLVNGTMSLSMLVNGTMSLGMLVNGTMSLGMLVNGTMSLGMRGDEFMNTIMSANATMSPMPIYRSATELFAFCLKDYLNTHLTPTPIANTTR